MTRSRRKVARGGALLCTLCLSAPPSLLFADEGDQAVARALFSEGRKLVDSGSYAEACHRFEESLRLDPGVGTSFNLADCQEHIGRTASAWARFLDVAAATRALGQPKRERIARARAAALAPKLARLVVEVRSPAEGIVVMRDRLLLDASTWGTAIPVDPGPHLVEARSLGHKDWSQSTTVLDAPTITIVTVPLLEPTGSDPSPSVALLPNAPPPAPAARSTHLQPAKAPRSEPLTGRSSVPAVGLAVLGSAAFATSAFFAFEVGSENGEAKALCPSSTCTSIEEKTRHDGLVDDAHRDRDLAFVAAGIGAAALLVASVLWWRPFRATSTTASVRGLSVGLQSGRLGADVVLDW